MWIAPEPQTLETLPQPDKPAHKKQPEQSRMETTRVEDAAVSSASELVSKVGFDPKHKEVAGLSLPENPELSRPRDMVASSETPAVESKAQSYQMPLRSPLHLSTDLWLCSMKVWENSRLPNQLTSQKSSSSSSWLQDLPG